MIGGVRKQPAYNLGEGLTGGLALGGSGCAIADVQTPLEAAHASLAAILIQGGIN
ncbi:hypothetical protein ES703_49663 [subsurface metagenome]